MNAASSARRNSGVKYVSMHGATGYGIAARRNILGLQRCGLPVTWTPMVIHPWRMRYVTSEARQMGDAELDPLCNRPLDYDTVVVQTVPRFFPEWVGREPGKRILGCTVWETDAIPKDWRGLLNAVDGLIVPCRWNKEVFEKCGVRVPIHVVPYLHDEQPLPAREDCHGIPADDQVFYTIGEWTERKAIWLIVRAFCKAFTAQDKVTLVIKTNRFDHTQSFWKLFKRTTIQALEQVLRDYPNPPRVKLLPQPMSDDEILRLHARGDCYVSLCRAEGWGMGAMDAARFGRPVIMTGYGGQLDFLPADLASLIRYRLIPADGGQRWPVYTQDQRWADPDVNHAAEEMRRTYESRDEAAERGRRLSQFVQSQFQSTHWMEKLAAIVRGEERA